MKVIDMELTGIRIHRLRKKVKKSRAAVAREVGVEYNAVYRWERGEALPSIDNLVNLADVLNTTINKIIMTDEVEI